MMLSTTRLAKVFVCSPSHLHRITGTSGMVKKFESVSSTKIKAAAGGNSSIDTTVDSLAI